jgi:hypothetical protein
MWVEGHNDQLLSWRPGISTWIWLDWKGGVVTYQRLQRHINDRDLISGLIFRAMEVVVSPGLPFSREK